MAWFAYMAVYQVDDAYIVYRYASNIAHGQGFVFNPGHKVEGVTCFLWTLMLSGAAALSLPLPVAAPVLTAACGLAMVWLVPGTSARLAGRPTADLWDYSAAALLAAHPAFAYWSVGALETVPFALLVLLALRDQAEGIQTDSGRRSALWIGAACLIRPETPLLAAGLLAGQWRMKKSRRAYEMGRASALWAGTVMAFLVPFLLFRRLYFGAWLPNTYYAKTGQGLAIALEQGRTYTLAFLASMAPGFGASNDLVSCIGTLMFIGALAYGLPRPRYRSTALLVAALGAAILFEGGDWMFLHRFWVPALAPILILMVAGVRGAVNSLPRIRHGAGVAFLLFLASFVIAGLRARNGPNGLAVNEAGYRFAHHAVAMFLKERARPGDVVALMDIGMIGFESGLPVIDISGLTEPKIARSPGGFLTKEYPPEELLKEAPRFFVLVDGFAMDDAIRKNPLFVQDYKSVFERNHRFNWTPPGSYRLSVFERVGSSG